KVELLPASGQNFVLARPGQQRQPDKVRNVLVAVAVEHAPQPLKLTAVEVAVTRIAGVLLDALARVVGSQLPTASERERLGQNAQHDIGNTRSALGDVTMELLDMEQPHISNRHGAKLAANVALDDGAIFLLRLWPQAGDVLAQELVAQLGDAPSARLPL